MKTLNRKNHISFILCPQSTITQWIGEIDLIEKGIGHSKDDYDILIVERTEDLMRFYNNHLTFKKGIMKFNKNTIKKPTYILCGKEAFKLSQVKRPAINVTLDRQLKPVLKCPNCGKEIIVYKKGKHRQTVEVAMQLEDFFKKDGKKSLTSSNIFCERCSKDLNDYNEFIVEQTENKNNENYQREYYNKHFVTKDKNLWTLDYNCINTVRNKIFSKIEPVKKLEDKYTKFVTVDKLKEELKLRKEKIYELTKDLDLRKEVTKTEKKKISVIEFIKKRKFNFDSVIIDEAHEGNNAKSLIGTAQRLLFKFSDKVILLSGTANNGYSSSLHNLLLAAMPEKLKLDGTFEKSKFIAAYGILQATIKVDDKGKVSGKSELSNSAFKEVEGINPVVFTKFLAKNFIMINSLKDLDLPMPELVEKYIPIETDEKQLESYNDFVNKVSSVNPYMAKMLTASTFKNFINNPYKWKEVEIKKEGDIELITPNNLDRNKIPYLPKDFELLNIILKEKEEGRKCFLFTDFVEGGKYIDVEEIDGRPKPVKFTINDRLCELLKKNDIRYTVIQSNTTSVANRKNYIEDKKNDYDVFICQPQLVNVGLNLVFCPTYIVYTPYYRYDIISQATRRGYRANSIIENRIYHLYYSNTCEETIINRYQRKLAEAKALEGEFDVNIEEGKNVRTLSKVSNDIVTN